LTKIELLEQLAAKPVLVRKIVQTYEQQGQVNLGSSGYEVPFEQYEALESMVAEGLVQFRKTEILGASSIERVFAEITPRGLLFLQSELAREAVLQ
jgi:hypothetical protein